MGKTIGAVTTANKAKISTKAKVEDPIKGIKEGYSYGINGNLLAIRAILIEIYEKVCQG